MAMALLSMAIGAFFPVMRHIPVGSSLSEQSSIDDVTSGFAATIVLFPATLKDMFVPSFLIHSSHKGSIFIR